MNLIHTAALPADLEHALRMAQEYRKGGRLAEAEALYRKSLGRYPQQPELLGQLGELLMQKGDFQGALSLLEQARHQAPGQPQHWLFQTQCLLELGRAKDAKKLITEAIRNGLRHPLAGELLDWARSGNRKQSEKSPSIGEELRQLDALFRSGRYQEVGARAGELLRRHPKAAQAWYLQGTSALALGKPQEAAQCLREAVKLDPRMGAAQFNLGFALERINRLDEALAACQKAVKIDPQLADAHNILGNVLQKLKRHDEALAAYGRALALKPDNPGFHSNRGDALRDLDRLEEAVAAYREAIRINPGVAEFHVNLSLALSFLGRHEESIEVLHRALEIRSNFAEAWQNMGHALRELKRYEEAVAAYRRGLELKPDDPDLQKSLGNALKDSGDYEAAIKAFERSLELRPESDRALNLLAGALLDAGRHDEALETYRQGIALDGEALFSVHSNLLLAINYQTGAGHEMLLAEARAFGEKAANRALPFSGHDNSPDPDRRLRIGLVSGDLGQHPVGYFLASVLENLDADKLEVFAYATNDRKDAMNERLRKSVPHWRDARVDKMSDEALARQIHADGIDILIDLAGHTAKNRLPIFAWKPAPVQVTWLGYLGTTGLQAMDYVLADRWALPVGEEDQFTETPWHLPESYICFSPPDLSIEVSALPALGKGYVTFGCFNNLNKINDEVVSCWSRLLQAVPDARLYLKTKTLGSPEMREKIVSSFARFGIAPERLILEGKFASHEDHFRAYNRVDIALDPFPYPGITTTVEALWMGVPVLSMRGARFISHQGETIMHNAGLEQWIAADEEEYIAKAAAFAQDINALATLRKGLREQLLASPLCDAPRFAHKLQAAFREMWQKWCAAQAGHLDSIRA